MYLYILGGSFAIVVAYDKRAGRSSLHHALSVAPDVLLVSEDIPFKLIRYEKPPVAPPGAYLAIASIALHLLQGTARHFVL